MKRLLATYVLGVCLGFCIVAASCAEGYGSQDTGSEPRQDTGRQDQASNSATPAIPATMPALTREALRSAEYAAGLPTFGTLQSDRIGAQDPLAFGDLDGDSVDDAAVLLLLVDGNAGLRYLAAVLNENGAPRHVASAFLGFNIGIDSVTITDGIVTLQTKQLGPNDPNCCPTKEVVVTFRLTYNAWQLFTETPAGSVTSNSRLQTATPTAQTPPAPAPVPVGGGCKAEWVEDRIWRMMKRRSGAPAGIVDYALETRAKPLVPYAVELEALYTAHGRAYPSRNGQAVTQPLDFCEWVVRSTDYWNEAMLAIWPYLDEEARQRLHRLMVR